MNPRDKIESGDPRWKEAHVCGNKTRMTESDAWRVAKRFRSKGDENAHAYRCPYCGAHHVGFQRDAANHRNQTTHKTDRRRLKAMRDAEDFDSQDANETDFLNDPAYIRFTAACEAEVDYDHGVSLTDGLAKLTARGADADERSAYAASYNAEGLRAMVRACGLKMENPYTNPPSGFNPFE